MAETNKVLVKRVVEFGGRDATVLEHNGMRVMIDDIGGMIPELSLIRGKQRLNAHWSPWFRSSSGRPYSKNEHGAFWKSNFLYHLAGNFPCIPNFGGDHVVDGVDMPAHGWTANLAWRFCSSGTDEETGAGWALSAMESPSAAMPLSFKNIDALIPGHNVHYSSISVKNNGSADLEICAGWHNTVGAPFLAEGCRISGAASAWATVPRGGEFDNTTRLALDAEFSSLAEAPLGAGGKTDISRVPGPIGYTDFAVGRIDSSVSLGWSSLVNPALKAAYLCFFPGPASAAEDDIVFRFNDLWMQYGGRNFSPWAPYEGGTDLTYCFGTENSISAYAMGLEYARQAGKLLGAPATVIIPGGKQKVIRYGTLFAPYDGSALDNGINSVEAESGTVTGGSSAGRCRFAADTNFTVLKGLEKRVG